jgi:hypothetical protein
MNTIRSLVALILCVALVRLQDGVLVSQSITSEQPQPCKTVLIDATHDGGVWWGPQSLTFDVSAPHQGLAFEDLLIKKGYLVQVLPRGWAVTLEKLRSFQIIIRANVFEPYSQNEVAAYKQVLQEGKVLILLSDHQTHVHSDGVADMMGVRFTGTITGQISKQDHPLFDGLQTVEYMAGSAVNSVTTPITPIAWVGSSPVVATSRFGNSSVLLMGDTNTLEVSSPFANSVVTWMGKQSCK